jgi:hypothetical protein
MKLWLKCGTIKEVSTLFAVRFPARKIIQVLAALVMALSLVWVWYGKHTFIHISKDSKWKLTFQIAESMGSFEDDKYDSSSSPYMTNPHEIPDYLKLLHLCYP